MLIMEDSSSCSSMVTGPPQASVLQRTLERLSSTQCLKLRAEEVAPLAVIALQRYLSEQSEGQQPDSYSYDVTVTDGVWRAKCFVHPDLNHLVHKNTLRTGTDVYITQCSFVYNERRLGHGYICIEGLRCDAQGSTVLPRINDVSSLPMLIRHGMERSLVLQSDVPLQVNRKHYLSLWNNDDPEGDIWTSGCPPSQTISLLSSLDLSSRNTWKPLPLLVKIIHKSRLRYYGKFGLKIDYPYQAYFEVADQSGTMSLVLWNELCPKFYQRLNVGTVLYLQNYMLKQSYSSRTRPQMDHHRMKTFRSIEICLNPRNPASVITVVSPKSVSPQWGLPEVSYQFTTRSEVDKLTNNSTRDVIGLVTFVSRVERVKCKVNKEKYWTYRWVHAVDGTSDQPFILELFSSSQAEIFSRICPMTYLVCTQMRVCQVEGSLPYLTSTCETEMLITGYHKGQPYVNDPRVKSFIQWTKTLKDNVVLQKTAVGGHYCYPHPPQIFTQSMADASAQVPLVSTGDLKKELETLHYREHKKLAIQGQITAVRYMKNPKTTQSQPPEEVRDSISKRLRHKNTQEEQDFASLQCNFCVLIHSCVCLPPDSSVLCWESSSWPKQREDVSEHLCQGGVYQDSISRRFTFDEKNVLLRWSNLQPTRWTPEQTADSIPPALCPGYYQVTILGINKKIAFDAAYLPVMRSDDPRAVGLPQDPHEEILVTASELEDTHVVCIVDLCHLGGDEVEILINKVYRVTEVSLD
uniref:RPA1 related single stranded DNA binding protein n=1 Tax=Amphiprion ocellaris TaxID=80972 RepID=A0A3Q1CQH5_AMPOC